jgi:hypothetical protein
MISFKDKKFTNRLSNFGKLARVLCVLCLSFSGVSQAAERVFPKPQCDTSLASDSLKERFQRNPLPSFDGNLPWPGVYGAWLNQNRGVWIQVKARQLSNEATQLIVELRSLCTNRVLASGTRLLNETDWKRPSLSMRLKDNREVSAEDLTVTLRPREIGENQLLEVRMMDMARTQGSTQIDKFGASRL